MDRSLGGHIVIQSHRKSYLMEKSHDPRVNRIELPQDEQKFQEDTLFQWQTYEVFQQQNRGEQHVHVGSLHAPNPEMALVLAKEQYGRREQCANLWVVKSADVHATSYDDSDMFEHAFDKSYRDAEGYKVKDTIEAFKKELFARIDNSEASGQQATTQPVSTISQGFKVYNLPTLKGKRPRKIITKA